MIVGPLIPGLLTQLHGAACCVFETGINLERTICLQPLKHFEQSKYTNGASVAFIDLTPPAPSPPPLVQLPASASCQKGSQLTAESTEQGSERTEDLVFGCLKDPGWKAYHMSLSAEVQKHWEAEQQGVEEEKLKIGECRGLQGSKPEK
eukprot:1136972-Pelagomonas_calceolata.AAC.3